MLCTHLCIVVDVPMKYKNCYLGLNNNLCTYCGTHFSTHLICTYLGYQKIRASQQYKCWVKGPPLDMVRCGKYDLVFQDSRKVKVL